MKTIIATILILAGLLALAALAISGPLYKHQILDLGTAFTVLRYAAFVGIGATVLCILFAVFVRPSGGQMTLLALAAVAGLITFYLPYAQYQTAQSVPPIHDITTDLENPPEFVAIAPLRADAPNPVAYAGEETAAQQREAYPQLASLERSEPASDIFAEALMVVDDMGWELVGSDIEEGRIEATDTTRWFGFKDDVVIRIVQNNDGAIVDVRSKSRVGRSDVGVNADRIERFLSALERRLNMAD